MNYDDWIPINEKPPEKGQYEGCVWEQKVLVTAYLTFDDTQSLFVTSALAEDVRTGNTEDICVTAWMPFPKPYRPEVRNNGKSRGNISVS